MCMVRLTTNNYDFNEFIIEYQYLSNSKLDFMSLVLMFIIHLIILTTILRVLKLKFIEL